MRAFQVGDLIIGLPSASNEYFLTSEGCLAKVVELGESSMIKIKIIRVGREYSYPYGEGEREGRFCYHYVLEEHYTHYIKNKGEGE